MPPQLLFFCSNHTETAFSFFFCFLLSSLFPSHSVPYEGAVSPLKAHKPHFSQSSHFVDIFSDLSGILLLMEPFHTVQKVFSLGNDVLVEITEQKDLTHSDTDI